MPAFLLSLQLYRNIQKQELNGEFHVLNSEFYKTFRACPIATPTCHQVAPRLRYPPRHSNRRIVIVDLASNSAGKVLISRVSMHLISSPLFDVCLSVVTYYINLNSLCVLFGDGQTSTCRPFQSLSAISAHCMAVVCVGLAVALSVSIVYKFMSRFSSRLLITTLNSSLAGKSTLRTVS